MSITTPVPTEPYEFKPEPIGEWGPAAYWVTDRDALIKYARATCASSALITSGDVAHPVYNAIPAMAVCDPMLSRIIPIEVKVTGLHGESDITFHRPLEPDMSLVSRATGVGFRQVPAGVLAIVRGETRLMDTNELINDQWVTIILRGTRTPEARGEDRPSRDYPRTAKVVGFETTFEPDTPVKYAKASGDYWPIHTSEQAARDAGLPGIINHGLCTLAFVTNQLIEHLAGDDPRRVRRIGARFASIVMPRWRLETTVHETAARNGENVIYGFDSVIPEIGRTALKGGTIEVAPG